MLYYAQISLILSTNDDHNTIQHHHSRLPGVMFENASKRKKGRRTKKKKNSEKATVKTLVRNEYLWYAYFVKRIGSSGCAELQRVRIWI